MVGFTEAPVTLTLRRGVVLTGRLLAHGAPRANERVLLIPAYVGSGPATREATTDRGGAFAFPRLVLAEFELVSGSLDNWHPGASTKSGTFDRIVAPSANILLHEAKAGRPVDLRVESYVLLPIPLEIVDAKGAAMASEEVDVWTRGGADAFRGTVLTTDASGRAHVAMELGAPYELWATRHPRGASIEAPWDHGAAPVWKGTPTQTTTLRLRISSPPR